MGVLSSRSRVSQKISAKLHRTLKNLLEVLCDRAKVGGAGTSPVVGTTKNVEFLFVCLCVVSVTLLNDRDYADDFATKALELYKRFLRATAYML